MKNPRQLWRLGMACALAGAVALAGCDSDSTGIGLTDQITFQAAGEGCTAEFWRDDDNLAHWSEEWSPDRAAGEHFPGLTLHDVIFLDGEGLDGLGREAVAAIQNGAHPDVDYGLTPDHVVSAFYEAVDAELPDPLRNVLEALNHRPCPL